MCFRDGDFLNTRCFTIDVTEKVEAEAALREAQERLAITYEKVLAGIAETDASGRFIRVNEAFVTISGYPREELLTKSFLDITHPDDIADDAEKYRRQVAGEIDHYTIEKRYIRKNGQLIWIEVMSLTVRAEDGGFAYGVRMVHDVTDRKLAEEHKKLLLDELNHRVKNTLATVQALVAHTARRATSAKDFQERFEPRLMALSAAHDRLTRNDWRGASLTEIVAGELRAHDTPGSVSFEGPDVILPSRVSLSLSMALHELATNASKYGALSVAAGRIDVHWYVKRDPATPYPVGVDLHWKESGGPPARQPQREGFGSRLLRTTAAELRGKIDVNWAKHGLEWRLSFPLSRTDFEPAT